MKLFLLNILLFLGFTKAYAGTADIFLNNVTKIEASESSASGCGECSGTERPGTNTAIN